MKKCRVIDRRRYKNFRPVVSAILVIAIALTIVVSTEAHNASEKAIVENYTIEIGQMYGICPELLQAIIESESGYQPNVVSDYGCVGLMQISPWAHQDRMNRLGVTDLTDPYQNILVGTDYIAELHQKYGDDLYCVLHAYHHGNALSYDENNPEYYEEHIVERAEQLEREHKK